MRTDYSNQLNAIESEFERERAALLSKNDEEIKSLFKLGGIKNIINGSLLISMVFLFQEATGLQGVQVLVF